MKLILDGASSEPVRIAWPSQRTLAALTRGGFGTLPGDAVTIDLAENEAKRIEAAKAMPTARAIENMLRSGHDAAFAARWIDALLTGGESEATGLDLIRQKSFMGREGQAAIEPIDLPSDRFFRDAWRRARDGIVIDMLAARTSFARRIIQAKGAKAKQLTEEIETAIVAGLPSDQELEARHEQLLALNLRSLGERVQKAETPEALKAMWPEELK